MAAATEPLMVECHFAGRARCAGAAHCLCGEGSAGAAVGGPKTDGLESAFTLTVTPMVFGRTLQPEYSYCFQLLSVY